MEPLGSLYRAAGPTRDASRRDQVGCSGARNVRSHEACRGERESGGGDGRREFEARRRSLAMTRDAGAAARGGRRAASSSAFMVDHALQVC
eukprot:scaffold92919_cov48-Phaeocystis_antarctica.AAC.2